MSKLFSSKGLMILVVFAMIFITACGSNSGSSTTTGSSSTSTATPAAEPEVKLTGTINIDGSSTVFPLTEGIAEEFGKIYRDVRVPVGVSGTGGGFKRFCSGETDISNASRPIKDEEAELCKTSGVEFIELPVAYDGLSVLVSPLNDWVDYMTVTELHEIFKPESTVKTWADVRAGWPDNEIKIYSPGADSGTFDYFTEAINKKSQASRNDSQITFSEDDNVLVQGISGDKYAIGYFGFSYYEENQDALQLVAIDGEKGLGPIEPNEVTINDSTYSPLSRPIFIYSTKEALERAEVLEFLTFYLTNAAEIGHEIGFIALPQEMYDKGLELIKN